MRRFLCCYRINYNEKNKTKLSNNELIIVLYVTLVVVFFSLDSLCCRSEEVEKQPTVFFKIQQTVLCRNRGFKNTKLYQIIMFKKDFKTVFSLEFLCNIKSIYLSIRQFIKICI